MRQSSTRHREPIISLRSPPSLRAPPGRPHPAKHLRILRLRVREWWHGRCERRVSTHPLRVARSVPDGRRRLHPRLLRQITQCARSDPLIFTAALPSPLTQWLRRFRRSSQTLAPHDDLVALRRTFRGRRHGYIPSAARRHRSCFGRTQLPDPTSPTPTLSIARCANGARQRCRCFDGHHRCEHVLCRRAIGRWLPA